MSKSIDKRDEALKLALEALEKCDSALAEELAAWDIDPPLHHVLEASNACAPAITAIRSVLNEHGEALNTTLAEQPRGEATLAQQQDNPHPEYCKGYSAGLEAGAISEKKPARQQDIDWKDQYEKQKRRAEMWIAKYEADIGPLEKAGPVTAQQQEPVAWANPGDLQNFDMKVRTNGGPLHTVPLCTSPQPSQRSVKPWVELTDAQIGAVAADIWGSVLIAPQSHQAFARAIEAKLKEKNA